MSIPPNARNPVKLKCCDRDGVVLGEGYLEDDNPFRVLKGSTARGYPWHARKGLVAKGVTRPTKAGVFEFVRDYVFNKPSPAASFILGRKAGGYDCWKSDGGQPLRELL